MPTTLHVGQPAPDFTARDQNGKLISLNKYKGKKIALFFYPKDDTPSCTTQACNLRDNIALLKRKRITVLGVSIDSSKMHKKYEQKYSLPFPLIADEDKEIVEKYGVWGEKLFMGRTIIGTHRVTFLIDENGIIAHIIDKVVTKNHTNQILEAWGL